MGDAWKDHERRTARQLGGRRLGATGVSNPDVEAGHLVAECKHRASLPQWLTTALGKVRTQAGAGRLGVVVLHERGSRRSIVCLDMADWRAWYGELPAQNDDVSNGAG